MRANDISRRATRGFRVQIQRVEHDGGKYVYKISKADHWKSGIYFITGLRHQNEGIIYNFQGDREKSEEAFDVGQPEDLT